MKQTINNRTDFVSKVLALAKSGLYSSDKFKFVLIEETYREEKVN